MVKRSYDQYCALARALDVVGERWTLLIVRELLAGPKRYTDLLDGLPGIPTNLLSARMKNLERSRLVRRRALPPPAASTVYELTELGAGLKGAVKELVRWGLAFMGRKRSQDSFHIEWAMLAFKGLIRPNATKGSEGIYEFRVGRDAFHVRVDHGAVTVEKGTAANPDLAMIMDLSTFGAVGSGQLDPMEAVSSGRIRIEGDSTAMPWLVALFQESVIARPTSA